MTKYSDEKNNKSLTSKESHKEDKKVNFDSTSKEVTFNKEQVYLNNDTKQVKTKTEDHGVKPQRKKKVLAKTYIPTFYNIPKKNKTLSMNGESIAKIEDVDPEYKRFYLDRNGTKVKLNIDELIQQKLSSKKETKRMKASQMSKVLKEHLTKKNGLDNVSFDNSLNETKNIQEEQNLIAEPESVNSDDKTVVVANKEKDNKRRNKDSARNQNLNTVSEEEILHQSVLRGDLGKFKKLIRNDVNPYYEKEYLTINGNFEKLDIQQLLDERSLSKDKTIVMKSDQMSKLLKNHLYRKENLNSPRLSNQTAGLPYEEKKSQHTEQEQNIYRSPYTLKRKDGFVGEIESSRQQNSTYQGK